MYQRSFTDRIILHSALWRRTCFIRNQWSGNSKIFGGNISLLTELCEKSRTEAFDVMVEHDQQIGANALVGVRYDTTELMSGVTEVLCYGTAVVLEKTD